VLADEPSCLAEKGVLPCSTPTHSLFTFLTLPLAYDICKQSVSNNTLFYNIIIIIYYHYIIYIYIILYYILVYVVTCDTKLEKYWT
jgi:hypothetical protein